MSEEFGGALPSVVMAEWLRLPAGLLEEIVEARSYAVAKARWDAADTPEARQRLPGGPLMALVQTITFDLVRDEQDDDG